MIYYSRNKDNRLVELIGTIEVNSGDDPATSRSEEEKTQYYALVVDGEGNRLLIEEETFQKKFSRYKESDWLLRIDGKLNIAAEKIFFIFGAAIIALIALMTCEHTGKMARQSELTNFKQQAVEFGFASYQTINEKENKFTWNKKNGS